MIGMLQDVSISVEMYRFSVEISSGDHRQVPSTRTLPDVVPAADAAALVPSARPAQATGRYLRPLPPCLNAGQLPVSLIHSARFLNYVADSQHIITIGALPNLQTTLVLHRV
jgi:hypothetical protein